jgi:hypothetical protein
MRIEDVPTREDHRRKAIDVLDRIKAHFSWAFGPHEDKFADHLVREWAEERHDARVTACWALCKDLGARYWPKVTTPWATRGSDILAAQAVAILALIGEGGPRDLGGPQAKSRLPLVDHDVFRWRSEAGKAWIAALKEVASHATLIIRLERSIAQIVVSGVDGELELWNTDAGTVLDRAVRAALRRAVLGEGAWVTDESIPMRWEGVPEDVDIHGLRVALAIKIYPEG